MEILKINQLPTPKQSDIILYNEQKEQIEAIYDWCKYRINEQLSKKSEIWLKNNTLIVDLIPNNFYSIWDRMKPVLIKLCQELRDNGYFGLYDYQYGYPGSKCVIHISINPLGFDNPVYIDKNTSRYSDMMGQLRFREEFEGEIQITDEPEHIFKHGCSTDIDEYRKFLIRLHSSDHYNTICAFDPNGINYTVKKKEVSVIEKVIKTKRHFWNFLK